VPTPKPARHEGALRTATIKYRQISPIDEAHARLVRGLGLLNPIAEKFSDRQTLMTTTQAHKPADSDVSVGSRASRLPHCQPRPTGLLQLKRAR